MEWKNIPHKYMAALCRDGKVEGIEWADSIRQCKKLQERYKQKYLIEFYDITVMCKLRGYDRLEKIIKPLIDEVEDSIANPFTVKCLTTGKTYPNETAASEMSGDSRYYIRKSCRDGKPTGRGLVWEYVYKKHEPLQ